MPARHALTVTSMRVASAGCPSPRPVFEGGENPSVCVARCGPRLLAPSPGRNHAGRESVVVTPACRVGAWDVLPVAGNEGVACAHARVPRGPRSPRSPEGACVRASGRGAEPSGGRAGLGGGGLPGPTRPPSVPRRERSLPRFPVFAVPADRGLAARVACVRRSCCVPCGGRLAPPSPAAFPRLGSSGRPVPPRGRGSGSGFAGS